MPEAASIKSVVICDDVRREDTGKWFLIGVYSKDIAVERVPTKISLSIWIEIDYLQPGELDFSFQATHQPTGMELWTVTGRAEVKAPERGEAIVMAGLPLQIDAEGTLELRARLGSEAWQVIKTIQIVLRPGRRKKTVPAR